MKNIAVMIPTLHNGGAERMAANLTIELQKKYNVYLVVFDGTNISYPYGGTLVNLHVPPLKSASIHHRLHHSWNRMKAVRNMKKKYGIDCTISHLEGANFSNLLSRRKDKVICVYHTMPSQEMKKNKINILRQRFIAKFSDKYVFVSKLAVHDIVHSFDVDEKKVMCIYNFSDTKLQRSYAQQAIEDEAAIEFYNRHDKIFIHVGRLIELKGQRHIIKAFSKIKEKHPNSGLVILGEGKERENLEKLVSELHLEQSVFMPGSVKNPFPYMKQSDVFVLASSWEGLPMVLIEAMVCGCPVVSTDMPSGARELLAPDTDILRVATKKEYATYGVLVPVCKEEGARPAELTAEEQILADAMTELAENSELRNKYIENSSKCAEKFDAATVVEQWVALIES